MGELYIFSRSLAAKCEVGQPFLNVPSMYREFFSTDWVPTVGDKVPAIVTGFGAYRDMGNDLTHYVLDPEGAMLGYSLRADGPDEQLETFFSELDALEKTFGLIRRTTEGIIVPKTKHERLTRVTSELYAANNVESLLRLDGDLERVD